MWMPRAVFGLRLVLRSTTGFRRNRFKVSMAFFKISTTGILGLTRALCSSWPDDAVCSQVRAGDRSKTMCRYGHVPIELSGLQL